MPSFLNKSVFSSLLESALGRPTRRGFLQAALATVASLVLPRVLFARRNSRSFWFLHTPTGESWAVDDPVAWSLANAQQPILERGRKRLVTLDAADPQRVIRLVTRRCKLNLIEVFPGRAVVHYWGQDGQGDLRPLFKQHCLARKEVEVVLIDRKRERSTQQHGDEFLYGTALAATFPLDLYLGKWRRRDIEEADDGQAAPQTWSGFGWEGIEPNRIPWSALKSAWRRTTTPLCPNCDQPTVLSNFGFPWVGMFNRYPRILYVCRECLRLFKDDSVTDVWQWMGANLDAKVRPDYDMIWDRPKKLLRKTDQVTRGLNGST